MHRGIVYVLINPAMPGFVKVGKTRNITGRLKALDKTNVPLPFRCVYAVELDDYERIEGLVHQAFSHARSRSTREFFEIDEQQIISALIISGGREVTPGKDIVADQESQDALNKATERRARFKFSMVGLTTGDVITYIKMPGITATICSDTKILFEGEEVSVSHATMALLERKGVHWKTVQGQQYWEYEGETLSQRRRRMEAE